MGLLRAQIFCRLSRRTLRVVRHQPLSRTLTAACGWRALMALMAAPLSGMATSDHSWRATFHRVWEHRNYLPPCCHAPEANLVPSVSSSDDQHATTKSVLPQPVSRGECLAIIGLALGGRPRYDRSATKTGMRALVFRVRRIRAQWQASRAETVQTLSSTSRARTGRTTVSSHHGFQHPE